MEKASNFTEFADRNPIPEQKNLYLLAMKEFESWFLLGSPWPVIGIVACYLLFTLKIGPEIMKNRKPLNITYIILAYNFYQSLSNGYMFSKLFTVHGAIEHLIKYYCHPMERAINPYCFEVANLVWLYLISKVLDLLDTIFFVLKKKQTHVTFLHVYHHSNMVLSTWTFAKYFHGEQLIIIGIVNTFVHMVMYAYYFLAALGPSMKKYLWWKIYVTRLQMVQFVIVIGYMMGLIFNDCELPEELTYFSIFQGITFFGLFLNFYLRTYVFGNGSSKSLAGSIATTNDGTVSSTSKTNGTVSRPSLTNVSLSKTNGTIPSHSAINGSTTLPASNKAKTS